MFFWREEGFDHFEVIKVYVKQLWDTVLYTNLYYTKSSSQHPLKEQLQKKSVPSGQILFSNICKHSTKFINIFPVNSLTVTSCIPTTSSLFSFPGMSCLLYQISCYCPTILIICPIRGRVNKQVKMGRVSLLCFFNVLKKKRKLIWLKMKHSTSWKRKKKGYIEWYQISKGNK